MTATPSHHIGPVLTGARVLVTAQRRAEDLALPLQRRGAEVTIASSLGVEQHLDHTALIAETQQLVANPPDAVVVTTGIGFRGWLEAADTVDLGHDLIEALTTTRIVARGPKARGAIQAAGLTPDWVAESETSAEIIDFLCTEGVAGQRIVILHHGAGDDGLGESLTDAGAVTTGLEVYRWGAPPDHEAVAQSVKAAASGEFDAVVFTSAPGAEAWLHAVGEQSLHDDLGAVTQSGRLVVLAVGPVTAEPLRQAGYEPLIPDRARLGALARSLIIALSDDADGVATVGGTLRVRATAATLDHELLPLTPGALCLLRSLAEAPGAVKSRGELLGALPGDSLDPHTVEMAIGRLREVVGRDVIQTVVKRGYRLAVG